MVFGFVFFLKSSYGAILWLYCIIAVSELGQVCLGTQMRSRAFELIMGSLQVLFGSVLGLFSQMTKGSDTESELTPESSDQDARTWPGAGLNLLSVSCPVTLTLL